MQSHASPLPRVSVAAPAAAATTVVLLLIMTELIRFEGAVPEAQPALRIVDVVRLLPRDEPPPSVPPRKPDEVEPPPETEVQRWEFEHGGDPIPTDPPVLEPALPPVPGGLPDGEMIPIVKVAPTYPQRAIPRGLEGYVLLEFTVDEQGRVVDPRVVEAEPRGVFDRAALKAVQRFKYKPRILHGEPVRVHGVLHRITFELRDA